MDSELLSVVAKIDEILAQKTSSDQKLRDIHDQYRCFAVTKKQRETMFLALAAALVTKQALISSDMGR